jgi:phosphatidylserine/phosphatidylglycerophosphate/cardiolipin synthase-like enzyme
MPNTGVTGTVVDFDGSALQNARAEAYDKNGLFGDYLLGSSITDAFGKLNISYAPGSYGLEANPDLIVRIWDPVKRLLYESPVHEDFSATVLDLGNIQLTAAATGLTVSAGAAGANLKSSGNVIEFLIDNETAWPAVTDSIRHAEKSIEISQLIIDALEPDPAEGPRLLTKFETMQPPLVEGLRIENELSAAVKRQVDSKKVAVRVLLNDLRWIRPTPIPGFEKFPWYPTDTAGVMVDYLNSVPADSQFEYRRSIPPLAAVMHAKVVIIDEKEAYLIGSPFLQEYYDDWFHRFDNPKRGVIHGGFFGINQIKVPIHDVSCYIRGPAVSDLRKTFCLLWNQADVTGGPPLTVAEPTGDPPGTTQLQIIRSLPGENRFAGVPKGETGIFEAYLRAIARAKDFIYFENQYLTCDEIFDAVIAALQANNNLEFIMVFNAKVDVPLYGGWQKSNLRRLIRSLPPGERKRIGLYTLWTHEVPQGGGKPRIIRNYVHSKTAILDDVWATVGSANLDGTGLTTTDYNLAANIICALFTGGTNFLLNWGENGVIDFKSRRSVEVNTAIFNDDLSPHPDVKALRRALWAEHLGVVAGPQNDPDPASVPGNRPATGWAKYWNDRAGGKVQGLKDNPATVQNVRVLPFPYDSDGDIRPFLPVPRCYLYALDITNALQFDTPSEVRSFSFGSGHWL